MNSTTGRGVKNWPNSPRKVVPRNFSKARPLISSPVLERSKFQLLDDAAESFLRDVELVGDGEQVVGAVVGLGLVEQAIVHRRIGGQANGCAAVEIVGGEGAVLAGTLHMHLDEQDFGDGVECTARVHLMHVAQDAVTDEQQVRKIPCG